MKVRAYMRVGYEAKRRRSQVNVTLKPSSAPLSRSDGSLLPTVAFGVDLEIPDEMFRQAEHVIATLSVKPESATIAAEVAHHDRTAA